MKKRVFIIHGWGADSKEDWFPWLRNKLEESGYEVYLPDMPNTETPEINSWVSYLEKIVGEPDKNTYFVGHSIGCQTILRYLERLSSGKIIGGVVLAAPWVTLMNLNEGEKEIAKPWIETPIDFEKVKIHSNNFFSIFSDNDSVVPINNKDYFSEKLGGQIILKHKAGHLNGDEGFTELPEVFDALLSFK